MRTVRRLAGIVALTVLVGAACGDDDTATGAVESTTTSETDLPTSSTAGGGGGGSDSDCPLELAEVEAAIGTSATPKEGGLAVAGGTTCEFDFENNGLVAVRTYTSDVQSSYELSLQVASDDDAVTGVGDMASWSQVLGTLFVVAGDTGLQVQIVQPGGAATGRDAAVAIAQAAVARL